MKTKVTLEKKEIEEALKNYIKEKMPEHQTRMFKPLREVNSNTI